MARRVLVVDADEPLRWSMAERLRADGREILEAATVEEAIEDVETGLDVVVLDASGPDSRDLGALRQIQAADPDVEIIVLLAEAGADAAADAVSAGAAASFAKPVDLDGVAIAVTRGLETGRVRRELRALREALARSASADVLVGESEAAQRVRMLVRKVATSPGSTVLIAGERGTGKDLMARVIHHSSGRAERPFVSVGCGSMTEPELEAALFGHERPARDGELPHQTRGLLDQADEGSMCLEDIEALPATLQAQLVRLLEDRLFRRVGGTTDRRVDVRIIATCGRDLDEEVRAGRFRGDLYYRLNVLRIELPPLRARPEDIAPLAQHFVDTFARKLNSVVRTLSDAAVSALRAYHWPGNVRELRNIVQRAVMLVDREVLEPGDFGSLQVPRGQPSGGPFDLPPQGLDLEDLEKQLVEQALEQSGGNQTRAASLLGLHRDQIRYRMEKYGFGKKA